MRTALSGPSATAGQSLTMNKQLTIRGTDWTVHESLDESVLERLLPRLDHHRTNQELTLVKDNNVRSAFLFRTGHEDRPALFVKRYKCRSFSDRCKYLLFQSKAKSEWRSLLRFRRCSLPCPLPLALHERRKAGMLQDSCLVMEAIDGAVPLNEYAEAQQDVLRSGYMQYKIILIQRLADLVRRLHAARIYYRDLHAGNILVRETDGGPELFFIDLHRALQVPVLMQWMITDDLAVLCNSLSLSRTDKIRFLRSYCTDLREYPADLRDTALLIGRRTEKLRLRRIRSRSKRCVKNSTVFEKKITWRERYHGRRDFGRVRAGACIGLHESELTAKTSTLKASSKSVLTAHDTAADGRVCVKGYRYLGLLYAAKYMFRTSRALKSWKAAHALMVRGIDTPLPLAIVERRCGPLKLKSYLITRWHPNARELNTYVQTMTDTAPKTRTAFLAALAGVILNMHERGIYHADLKSNNILVEEREDGGWRFYIIDLDRVRFDHAVPFEKRVNNLAQINASVADCMTVRDRLKFFRIYAAGCGVYTDRKKYYRRIIAIGRTKITEPYGLTFA